MKAQVSILIRRLPPFSKPGFRLDNTFEAHDVKLGRKPRADSVRNHQTLLAAAKAVFASDGPVGSLEAVARMANVGIGTLYRHFPSRQALFEAVYRHEVDHLVALAATLAREAAPLDALRLWMRANVEFVATKKGMSATLAISVRDASSMKGYAVDRLGQAADVLLQRAAAAGEVRDGISAEDIMRTVVGLCYTHDQPGWQASVLRLVDVFADGLKRR